jgi:adenine-specific DNA-methyltransferase
MIADIRHCRAEDLLPTIADGTVSLVCVDPPYFRVKDCAWDNAWKTEAEFLAWIGRLCDEFRRVLKPNGSLYLFASPQMAWGVEGEVRKQFNVINRITWAKPGQSFAEKYGPENFRGFVEMAEWVIFAEQGDSATHVCEPIRAYLDGERNRAGLTKRQVDEAWCKFKGVAQTAQSQKWFTNSCWGMPTAEAYQFLRELFNQSSSGNLARKYEDLSSECKYARREYEDLRRPFFATTDRPYTDVWSFPTVGNYPGKHPCEKPLEMIEHIVQTSSRPGDLVLDCFLGSGVTAHACQNLGREFIGCDADEHWVKQTARRLEGRRQAIKPVEYKPERFPLFKDDSA